MKDLDPDVRARAWDRWVSAYPTDADCDRETQDAILDTFAGHRVVMGVLVDDLTEPARTAVRARLDQSDARIRDMQDAAVRRLMRYWQ